MIVITETEPKMFSTSLSLPHDSFAQFSVPLIQHRWTVDRLGPTSDEWVPISGASSGFVIISTRAIPFGRGVLRCIANRKSDDYSALRELRRPKRKTLLSTRQMRGAHEDARGRKSAKMDDLWETVARVREGGQAQRVSMDSN